MRKKIIPALLIIIFGLLVLVIIINTRRKTALEKIFTGLNTSNVSHLEFYKDILRDSEELHLEVTDEHIKRELIANLNTLTPSGITIKGLRIIKKAELSVKIKDSKYNTILLTIYRAKDYGNKAIISVTIPLVFGETSGGVFTSDELLLWLETLSQNPPYTRIWEVRN